MISTNKEPKMKLLNWIINLFKERTYKDSLEYFISSKKPQSTAEVEYWTRYYDQYVTSRSFL
jgi:hypothetical protein